MMRNELESLYSSEIPPAPDLPNVKEGWWYPTTEVRLAWDSGIQVMTECASHCLTVLRF